SRLGTCRNTLNIADDEIPLYVGQGKDTSPTSKFFASSDYLVGLAQQTKNQVVSLEQKARDAYIAQRLSSFQTDRGSPDGGQEKKDRVNGITITFEDQLKKYCGTPPGEGVNGAHPLVTGFQSGGMTAAICYLKLEDKANCSHGLKGEPLDGSTPFE